MYSRIAMSCVVIFAMSIGPSRNPVYQMRSYADSECWVSTLPYRSNQYRVTGAGALLGVWGENVVICNVKCLRYFRLGRNNTLFTRSMKNRVIPEHWLVIVLKTCIVYSIRVSTSDRVHVPAEIRLMIIYPVVQ
jgi:hypothetical protein